MCPFYKHCCRKNVTDAVSAIYFTVQSVCFAIVLIKYDLDPILISFKCKQLYYRKTVWIDSIYKRNGKSEIKNNDYAKRRGDRYIADH